MSTLPSSLSTVEVFERLDEGDFLPNVGKALKTVQEAVLQTGKGGDITIKIKVTPDKKTGRIVLTPDPVKAKIPQQPCIGTVLFVDDKNSLFATAPNQTQMQLTEARDPKPTLQRVAN